MFFPGISKTRYQLYKKVHIREARGEKLFSD